MRNEFLETVSRKHFLNKCDIRNIRIKVQDRLVICHQDDAQSVYLAVAELQQEPFNPVMAFKVQGSKNPVYPTLLENAFLLALQTEFQRELYRKYAGRVLCTHGTNAYRYKLITCIVPHHYGQGDCINNPQFAKHNIIHTGEPIAWCISDRETTEVIEVFFKCIQERSPGVKVNVLMTDDGMLCVLHTGLYTCIVYL